MFSVPDDRWMCACFKDDFYPHSPSLLVLVQLVRFLSVKRREAFQPCHLQDLNVLFFKESAQFFGQKPVCSSEALSLQAWDVIADFPMVLRVAHFTWEACQNGF